MDLQRASTATWGPKLPTRRRAPSVTAGERLGVYEIERWLGEGGMARVYGARHTMIDRKVAIKRLLPELATVAEAHGLLLREARIAGAIRHRNLLEIYDFGYDTLGRPYYVMELAKGETLGARLRQGPLLETQALDVAIEVADAVAAVHAAGYVHRDIKSDNVMLATDGGRLVLKLIDFGIARRLDEGDEPLDAMAGTPRAMAPEQIARDPIDERTDVWGIGVLLYEMLTAALPFEPGSTLRDDLLAIVTEPPRPLPAELDAEVRAVVGMCLRKDPADRPADAIELANILRVIQARYLDRRGLIARRRR